MQKNQERASCVSATTQLSNVTLRTGETGSVMCMDPLHVGTKDLYQVADSVNSPNSVAAGPKQEGNID
eukprot:3842672-Amphidinium_carterae.1